MSKLATILQELGKELELSDMSGELILWPDKRNADTCLQIVESLGGERRRHVYVPTGKLTPTTIESCSAFAPRIEHGSTGGRIGVSAQRSWPSTADEIDATERGVPLCTELTGEDHD